MRKCGTANHRLSTKSRYSGEHPANTNSTQQTSWGGQDTTLGAFFGIYLRKKANREEETRWADKQAEMESHQSPNPSKFLQFRLGWTEKGMTAALDDNKRPHAPIRSFHDYRPSQRAADEYCGLEIRRLFSTRQPYKVVTTSNKVKVRPLTTPPTPTWTNNSR